MKSTYRTQLTRLGYTELNISAQIHLYQRTQYLESKPLRLEQGKVKIHRVFHCALFTRFQNLNTGQLISLTKEV